MFRQSYPQDGEPINLADELRGVDFPNHRETQDRTVNQEAKYDHYQKGFKSMSAEGLIEVKRNQYKG